MFGCLGIALLIGPVLGARLARKPDASVPTIRATVGSQDASGHWSATAPPGLFQSTRLAFIPPGSDEIGLELQASGEASGLQGAASSGDIESQPGVRQAGGGTQQVAALRGSGGSAEMTAVLQKDGTIAGSVVDPVSGMVHQFMGEDGGELRFTSTRSDKFPEELEPEGEELEGEEPEESPSDAEDPNMAVDDGSMLDVMVVWSKQAECRNAGQSASCSVTSSTESQMWAKINLAIQETNDAYTASRIYTQLRLVHAYRHPSYVEKGFSTDLNNLRIDGDGEMDDVHTKRSQFGADIVAFINQDSEYCGLARIGPGKSSMFSVTQFGCATGYYSFGHEIGHNLGARHDRGASNACSSSRSYYGYRDPAGMWRDTLSYACKSSDCLGQPVGGSCTRMKFYSNPSVNYQGKASGWSGKADLAGQINGVRVAVSRYNSPPTPSRTVLKDITAIAQKQGMDHMGLRDQLRTVYPSWEWLVLQVKDSWSWSLKGYTWGSESNLIALGYQCSTPPACGNCSSFTSVGHTLNRATDNVTVRKDNFWTRFETNGVRNVLTSQSDWWGLAWFAKPVGYRCFFYGSDAAGNGQTKVFAVQMQSASSLMVSSGEDDVVAESIEGLEQ